MAFSSGFLSPPSSQALSWTSHTVSMLIPPDLYWVQPDSSASCSGPKQNKIWISAWYILKNERGVSAWLWSRCCKLSFSFLFLKVPSHRQRSEAPKFTHKSTHVRMSVRTHAHTHTRFCEQTKRLYLQYTQHPRVCGQSWKTSHQHLPDGSKSLNIIKK